jgi:hypothetical protein
MIYQKKAAYGLGLFIVALTLCGCEQARVDAQMEALCKKDGGMKIYEKVVLPKDQFTKFGDPVFFNTWNESGGGYKFVSKSEQIKVTRPSLDVLTWNHTTLTKDTSMVIREADNKILGTYVYYLRVGGAIMPRLGPDPARLCPKNHTNFLRTIFVPEN